MRRLSLKNEVRRRSLIKSGPLLFAAVGAVFGSQAAQAATSTWSPSTLSASMALGTNWDTPPVSGSSTIAFGTAVTTTLTDDLSTNFRLTGITFNAGASTFVINSGTFQLNGDIANNSSSTQTVNSNLSLLAPQITVSGGSSVLLGGTVMSTTTSLIGASRELTNNLSAGNLTLNNVNIGFLGETAGSARTLTLDGTGNTVVSGLIANGGTTANNNVTYAGTGTLTINSSASNTYSGTTTVSNGALVLDYSNLGATPTNLLRNGNALTIGAATVTFKGKASATNAQTLGTLSTTAGAASSVVIIQSGGSFGLTLAALSRAAQSTLDIVIPTGGTITLTASNGTNGINTPSATGVAYSTANNGATWLASSGTTLSALTTFTTGSSNYGGTKNIDVTNGDTPAAGTIANTLRFNSASSTLTLAGASTLTTGGILVTNSGTGAKITGGTIGGTSNKEIVIHDYGSLTVDTVIIGPSAPVTITGTGTTTFTKVNTYTGNTEILGGTLKLGINNSINMSSNMGVTPTGTLDLAGSTQAFGTGFNNDGIITSSGVGTATLTQSGTGTGSGNFTGSMNLSFTNPNSSTHTTFTGSFLNTGNITLNNTGSTVIELTGQVNNTGNITVTGSGGFVQLAANGAIGSNVASIIQNTSSVITSLLGDDSVVGGFATGTGTVVISTGTLSTGSSKALGAGNVVSIGTTGFLRLNAPTTTARNQTIAGLADISGAGGTVTNTDTATAVTLSLGGSGTYSFSGSLTATTAANLGINKTGTGTQTLSGSSSYAGTTTVSQGTLVIGAAAPSGSAGVLGNATSAVAFGSTTLTGAASLLTNGAFTVGRDITEVASATNASLTLGGNQTSGSSTYTGNVTLTKDTTLTAASGGEVDFTTGVISGSANVVIDGGGTVQLAGTNTFGGAAKSITVQGGSTLLASTGATGGNTNLGNTSNALIFNNGTLKFGAAFDPTGRTITVNGGGATFNTNGANVTFANAIGNSGTGGVAKAGAGTLTLSGVNAYTGLTTVNGGTLTVTSTGSVNNSSGVAINGSGANFNYNSATTLSKAVTFGASGGTLSGSGTIGGLVTTAGTTSILSPGNSPSFQAYTAGLNAAMGARFKMELSGDNTTTNASDRIVITNGGLTADTLGTGTLVFDLVAYGVGPTIPNPGQIYTLVSFDSSSGLDAGDLALGSITSGLVLNTTYGSANGFHLDTSGLNGGGSISVEFDSVPEPTSLGVLGLGAIGLLSRRRRRLLKA